MKKPLTPKSHGLIDYGLAAGNLLMPSLLHFPRRSQAVFAVLGVIQGGLNAVTVQPLAVKKEVPFKLHGRIEKYSIPVFLIAPLLAGTQKNRSGLAYWLATGIALVAVYNLTDWDAKPDRN